jgi:DNA-binding transcriptional ArsR family regulator
MSELRTVRLGLDMYIASWKYSHMGMNVHADRLSLAFAALADPTRRTILARLASGEADVSELMKPFRPEPADNFQAPQRA